MKHDRQFAMDLIGQRVLFRQRHRRELERHLITRTTLTDKDVLLRLDNDQEVFLSDVQLIIEDFSTASAKSETASAT